MKCFGIEVVDVDNIVDVVPSSGVEVSLPRVGQLVGNATCSCQVEEERLLSLGGARAKTIEDGSDTAGMIYVARVDNYIGLGSSRRDDVERVEVADENLDLWVSGGEIGLLGAEKSSDFKGWKFSCDIG